MPVSNGSVDRHAVRVRGQEMPDLARFPVYALAFPQPPQIDRADPDLAGRLAEGAGDGHGLGNPAGVS